MANNIRHLLDEAVKSSMKERNKERTSTLRMAISEIKKDEIDKQTEISAEDSIKILQRMIKQRKESSSQFSDAGRNELAAKEDAEILILEEFLPQQMSESEIEALVIEAIQTTGAQEPQDIGKVMGSLKSKISVNADMGLVSTIVKNRLQK